MNSIARAVIDGALRAADPAEAVRRHWPEELGEALDVDVLAVGKGAPAMALASAELLGGRLGRGLVVAPGGLSLDGLDGFEVVIGDHPIPSGRSLRAGRAARAFVENCESDRLLVLVSGGGSALMIDPREGVDLDTYAELTRALLGAGATIDEVNAVRRAVDRLKGGGLARLAGERSGTPVTGLILSDVLGDAVETVSSGPTATGVSGPAPAAVLGRWGFAGRFAAVDLLCEQWTAEPAKADNRIVGSNRLAVDAVAEGVELGVAGLDAVGRRYGVKGEASEVGRELAAAVRSLEVGSMVVWGGETTVRLGEAPGRGGRNQELALAAAVELDGDEGAHAMAFGTDGIDGPTDAAGGVVGGGTVGAIAAAGIDAREALRRHDSYPALAAAGALIVTGRTGTNVNDLYVGWRG